MQRAEPDPRCAGGDPGERLAALEPRLRLLLLHLAGRSVRERVDLEDLLQEVYLRALASSGGLPAVTEGESALWRLLARIARNTVIDVARALRAARRDGRTEPLARSDWSRTGAGRALPSARGPGPATAAAAEETSRSLATRFLELPGEYRRVIGLRQFEGLSARETASRMGRSEAAIHSLYRRALAAWERALERETGSPGESAAGPRSDSP